MPNSNATYVYVTGPVHVYVRVPVQGASTYNPTGVIAGNGAPYYLGTTEGRPEINGADIWVPYHNAISGEAVQFDRTYGGPVEEVNLDLSKFSQTVYDLVADSPNYGRAGVAVAGGAHNTGDRGKMLIANGCSFEMWLVNHLWWFRAQATNMAAFPDLHPGVYYRACNTKQKYRGRDGVTPSMAFLGIEANEIWDGYNRTWFMKSHDPAFFANLPDPL